MKFTYFFAFLLFCSASAQAQKKVKQARIQYTITVESDNPMAAMMNGSTMDIYFQKNSGRFDMNMMSGMVEMQNVMNDKDGLITMNMMGQKNAVPLTKKDIEDMKEKQKGQETKSEDISYDKEDTKEILGYTCYLATITNPAMEAPMKVYVTEAIQPKVQTQVQKQMPGMKGFPLEYTIDQGGMTITMTATNIQTKKLAKDTFKTKVPEDYTEMTLEEFMNMSGGGGGMFGM